MTDKTAAALLLAPHRDVPDGLQVLNLVGLDARQAVKLTAIASPDDAKTLEYAARDEAWLDYQRRITGQRHVSRRHS